MTKVDLASQLTTYVPPSFDYAGVPEVAADKARGAAERIRSHQRAAIIEIGQELLAVKEALGHGHFAKWLDAEFNWSTRSAQNYMQAATAFGSDGAKYAAIAYLPATMIYRLSAPSTPPAILESVVQAAASGQHTSIATLKHVIEATKAQEAKKESRARRKNPSPEDQARSRRREQREAREQAKRDAEMEAETRKAREAAQIVRDALGERLGDLQALFSEDRSYSFRIEFVAALLKPVGVDHQAAKAA